MALETMEHVVTKTLAFVKLKYLLNKIDKQCVEAGENEVFEKAKSYAPDLIDDAFAAYDALIDYFYLHYKSLETDADWEKFLQNYGLPYLKKRREISCVLKQK